MIKALIFDFGNVFINLDIEGAQKKALNAFQVDELSEEMIGYNSFYEQGLISTEEFLSFYTDNFPNLSNEELVSVWNSILKDFPEHRLNFLQKLKSSKAYKLILLSNTNEIHINWIKENISFYEDFKSCFDAFYLSYEINLIKPNQDIFKFVLNEHKLTAEECLFIDDNAANISSANALKLNTWHIKPSIEDVTTLFNTKKNLF